jgi:hypothetical protein
MDSKDREILERMANAQERIVSILGKPENSFLLVLQYGSGIVAVFGVVAIIDTIVKWITGG